MATNKTFLVGATSEDIVKMASEDLSGTAFDNSPTNIIPMANFNYTNSSDPFNTEFG